MPCWLPKQTSHAIYTAQIDICQDVGLTFENAKDYQQVVWSNCEDLSISFVQCPEHNLSTGLAKMKQVYSDVNDVVDQFFVRFVGEVLTEEVLIRLPGGFPTTDREATEWELQHPHAPKVF